MHALGDESGQFANLVLGVFAHHLFQLAQEGGLVALLQVAHGIEEHEFGAVCTEGVFLAREGGVGLHLAERASHVGGIGRGIE